VRFVWSGRRGNFLVTGHFVLDITPLIPVLPLVSPQFLTCCLTNKSHTVRYVNNIALVDVTVIVRPYVCTHTHARTLPLHGDAHTITKNPVVNLCSCRPSVLRPLDLTLLFIYIVYFNFFVSFWSITRQPLSTRIRNKWHSVGRSSIHMQLCRRTSSIGALPRSRSEVKPSAMQSIRAMGRQCSACRSVRFDCWPILPGNWRPDEG